MGGSSGLIGDETFPLGRRSRAPFARGQAPERGDAGRVASHEIATNGELESRRTQPKIPLRVGAWSLGFAACYGGWRT